jgi:hypothetical protein
VPIVFNREMKGMEIKLGDGDVYILPGATWKRGWR